ncbi:MFS transporter [Fulvivirga sp.]|uniref:MFS transporter n=1 Tax=Fulvivirga sp. TaxID=1931237 RepID=UPI0032EEFE7C
MNQTESSKIVLFIVLSQFCCTSLWFAGNAILNELVLNFNLPSTALGHLTSSVQFGFITGTLIFALLTIADRFSPSKVFLTCALIGAFINLGVLLPNNGLWSLVAIRFGTGFFLAGIYPVGMKIAADHFEKGLGKSLGFLVGALVLGTAFPHFIKSFINFSDWKSVIIGTTSLAATGGLLMALFVPDGPFRKAGQQLDVSAFFRVFKNSDFRTAAFGYFGHMWELYTFWAFVPFILMAYNSAHLDSVINVPLLSFLIIGIGGPACVMGGYAAQKLGTKNIATLALALSCICCLLSPLILTVNSSLILIGFLLFWGVTVIADSPLFSTLVAQNANPEIKGTALTIVNCIGFAITIVSIQVISWLQTFVDVQYLFLTLSIGPVLGLIALSKKAAV